MKTNKEIKIDRSLHEKIYNKLITWHKSNSIYQDEKKTYFRLRRTNRYNRLQEGFWFHGTENYFLLSFWTGSDWKNKTPNISFLFTIDGNVSIELSGKDSENKFQLIQNYFKPRLKLNSRNLLKNDESYKSKIYVKSLSYKWNNENITQIIDDILEKEKKEIDNIFDNIIQDSYYINTAGLGYLTSKEFQSLVANVDSYRSGFENIVFGGSTISNIQVLVKNKNVEIEKKIKDYQSLIPFGLKELKITQYKQLKNINVSDIPSDTQWIFITGENGSGKSSILECIAISMMGNIDDGVVLHNGDITISSKFTNQGAVSSNSLSWENNFYKKRKITPIINFACYGPNRFDISSNSTISKINHSSKTYNLFNNNGNLFSIENEMLIWKLKGDLFASQEKLSMHLTGHKYYNQKFGSYHKYLVMYENAKDILIGIETNLPFPRKVLKNVKKNNKGFLPNVNNMSFLPDKNDNIMYYYCDESSEPLKFNELSTGNKSLLAMVGDLIVRFCKYYYGDDDNEINVDFSNFSGIVLIDEIDAHLHPQWQYEIPSLLSEAFPKIQFIVTCHSPIPLLGVKDGECRSVYLKTSKNEIGEINVEKVILNTSELTPNSIFSSPVFGFTNFLSKAYTYENGFSSLSDYNEILFEKMLQKKIKELDYEKSNKKPQ